LTYTKGNRRPVRLYPLQLWRFRRLFSSLGILYCCHVCKCSYYHIICERHEHVFSGACQKRGCSSCDRTLRHLVFGLDKHTRRNSIRKNTTDNKHIKIAATDSYNHWRTIFYPTAKLSSF